MLCKKYAHYITTKSRFTMKNKIWDFDNMSSSRNAFINYFFKEYNF